MLEKQFVGMSEKLQMKTNFPLQANISTAVKIAAGGRWKWV